MSAIDLPNLSLKTVQASTFSRGAYTPDTFRTSPPEGFKELKVVLTDQKSPDFAAIAYINPKTGEMVVAYRGSDDPIEAARAAFYAKTGTWNGQFTDAANFYAQAKALAQTAVTDYGNANRIPEADRPEVSALITGHSLGGLLSQVVSKMFGVEAQVFDSLGGGRLVETTDENGNIIPNPNFARTALENGQPAAGHDITGKIQNYAVSIASDQGVQMGGTTHIPALGQLGGLEVLPMLVGAFTGGAGGMVVNAAGTFFGEQLIGKHSKVAIEDAMYTLAGLKPHLIDAGQLSLKPMYLGANGQPSPYPSGSNDDGTNPNWRVLALVDADGKAVAYIDRQAGQPVAVVVETGVRIQVQHPDGQANPAVIEIDVHGQQHTISQDALKAALATGYNPAQDARSGQSINGSDAQSDQYTATHDTGNASGTYATNGSDSQSDHYATGANQPVDTVNAGDAATNSGTLDQITDAFQAAAGQTASRGEQYAGLNTDTLSDAGGGAGNSAIEQAATQATQQTPNTLQSALGLAQSLIGLTNWGAQTDLQHLQSAVGLYNQFNTLSGGALGVNTGLGNLAGFGSGLGLISAIQNGNIGGAITSGVALGNFLSESGFGASQAIADALGLSSAAVGNIIPGLNLVFALGSGDAWSSLSAAAAFIPGGGPVISIGMSLFGGMFGGDDIPDYPTQIGLAQVQWNSSGHLEVVTLQNTEGGGGSATGVLQNISNYLQNALASNADLLDAQGQPLYGVIPQKLPQVGFTFDLNAGQDSAQMYLKWTDEDGQSQSRYYDQNGKHGEDDLGSDYMKFGAAAIVPAWEAATVQAHWLQTLASDGREAADAQAAATPATGLPQESLDQLTQSFEVLTLGAQPTVTAPMLNDIDGDGFMEQSQWVDTNAQILTLDKNSDGVVNAGELLTNDSTDARSNINWLDANQDHKLDQNDAAFSHLKVWADKNSDGLSQEDELQSLSQAGITAINLGETITVTRADGSTQAVTQTELTGTIKGEAFEQTEGGILQKIEDGETTLNAVNTREFDGQADQINDGENSTVQAGDTRISSTTSNTIENSSTQTERRAGLKPAPTTQPSNEAQTTVSNVEAGSKPAIATQPSNEAQTTVSDVGAGFKPAIATQTTTISQIRSNAALGFVPLTGTNSQQRESQSATAQMIAGAENTLFGLASAPFIAVAAGLTASAASAEQSVQIAQVVAANETLPPSEKEGPGGIEGAANANASSNASPNASSDAAAQSSGATVVGTDLQSPLAPLLQRGEVVAVSPAVIPTKVGIQAAALETQDSLFNAQGSSLDSDFRRNDSGGDGGIGGDSGDGSFVSTPTNYASTSSESTTSNSTAFANTSASNQVSRPQLQGELIASSEDSVIRISAADLLANDINTNSAPLSNTSLTITQVASAIHGQVALQTNSSGQTEVVFTPDQDYHGPASFSYTVTDQYGLSSTTTSTLNIAAVNDAPVTQDTAATSNEDNVVLLNSADLLGYASDVDTATDGDVLRITRVGSATHGSVSLSADGTQISYTPDANYNGTSGPAQFTYWVSDGTIETAATMNLTVLAINDAPVVTGENVASNEDVALTFTQAQLLANDSDVDVATNGQVLSISAVSGATHGTVSLNPDGSISFTPEANYFGTASFIYSVNDGAGGVVNGTAIVNLAPVNDAPDVVGESITFDEDTPQLINSADLLANDSDVDNAHSQLFIQAVGNATHGQVSLQNGQITFTPNANYNGVAQFSYDVADGAGGLTRAWASLNITPVNDAPVTAGEAVQAQEDSILHFTTAQLLANDSDVDTATNNQVLSISSVSNASHGQVALQSDGQIIFTPDLNFNGAASFNYTVDDGNGGQTQAQVNITFDPVNDAPIANSESFEGKRNVAYTFTQAALLANDLDPDIATNGQTLHIAGVQNAQHGLVQQLTDGSITFTPEANYAGVGSFDYVVQDSEGAQSIATMAVNLAAVNINPTATNDSFTGFEDTPFVIAKSELLVNDVDPDADAISYLDVAAVGNASHGQVSLQSDGSVRFAPDANYFGTASFDYQVIDHEGGATWASASLNVQSVNDAPVVEAMEYNVPIYGYRWVLLSSDMPLYLRSLESMSYSTGMDGEVGYRIKVPVTSEAQALYYLNGGVDGSIPYSYSPFSSSHYINGHLKPVEFSDIDAVWRGLRSTYDDGDVYTETALRDPFRNKGHIAAYDPDGPSGALSYSIISAPTHGYAWINQTLSESADFNLLYDHNAMIAALQPDLTGWQYYSQWHDPYSGDDPFVIRITDSDGAYTDVTIAAYHQGTTMNGGLTPLVLDLNQNGVELLNSNQSLYSADVNGDGKTEHIGWAAPTDGVLVYDKNQDQHMNGTDEISFVQYKEGAQTDLEGLQTFDSSGDGKLTAADEKWNQLGVFQDKNNNGVQDEGEYQTLEQMGIQSLNLQSDNKTQLNNGNVEFGQIDVTYADGHSTKMADVMFAGKDVPFADWVQERLDASVSALSTAAGTVQSGISTVWHGVANTWNSFYDSVHMVGLCIGDVMGWTTQEQTMSAQDLAVARINAEIENLNQRTESFADRTNIWQVGQPLDTSRLHHDEIFKAIGARAQMLWINQACGEVINQNIQNNHNPNPDAPPLVFVPMGAGTVDHTQHHGVFFDAVQEGQTQMHAQTSPV